MKHGFHSRSQDYIVQITSVKKDVEKTQESYLQTEPAAAFVDEGMTRLMIIQDCLKLHLQVKKKIGHACSHSWKSEMFGHSR